MILSLLEILPEAVEKPRDVRPNDQIGKLQNSQTKRIIYLTVVGSELVIQVERFRHSITSHCNISRKRMTPSEEQHTVESDPVGDAVEILQLFTASHLEQTTYTAVFGATNHCLQPPQQTYFTASPAEGARAGL